MSNHFDDIEVGEIILFGNYPQNEPIEWRVLDKNNNELLLVSLYILDCKRYHNEEADITWKDCSLRAWLLNAFYNEAFSEKEKELIKYSKYENFEDKISLLSETEILRYFDEENKKDKMTIGTKYAYLPKEDGCRLYEYDKSEEVNYLMIDNIRRGCSWWWLRDQGNKPSRACFVGTRGSIRHYGSIDVPYYGVRPIIKIVV